MDYSSGDVIASLEISDGDGDAILSSILSGNFDKDGDTILPFEVNEANEILLADMDDIKQLAGQEVTLDIKLDDRGDGIGEHGALIVKIKLLHSEQTSQVNSSGSDSSEQPRVEKTENVTDVSILEGFLNLQTNWYESSWFGTFYAAKEGWIFHQKLGWLYIHPDSNNGFWCWDPVYQAWWWSSKQHGRSSDIFYFYLYSSDPEKTGWGALDLSIKESRIYEFFKSAWILR